MTYHQLDAKETYNLGPTLSSLHMYLPRSIPAQNRLQLRNSFTATLAATTTDAISAAWGACVHASGDIA